MMVMTKYSRLFCDVNRPITSENLCRKEGDGRQIELNAKIEEEEEEERLRYYHSYFKSIRDVQN